MPPYRQNKADMYDLWRDPATSLVRCVCGGLCYSPPQMHHLIVPRNYGVTINEVWNCVPVHATCHDRAHAGARDEFVANLIVRLATSWKQSPAEIRAYIREQLNLLSVKVDLPPSLTKEDKCI